MDPDLPIIEALQAGTDWALNELIERHREPLFHFVYRYLHDETAAHDVVQETFVRVYFNAKNFVPRSTVKTWLYTIALNLSRDAGRKLAKRQREISLQASNSNDMQAVELKDTAASPDSVAGTRDLFTLLQRAIANLPERLRTALVLCSLEGKSQREAAEILGTTPKSVELRVAHARQKLHSALADQISDKSSASRVERPN